MNSSDFYLMYGEEGDSMDALQWGDLYILWVIRNTHKKKS